MTNLILNCALYVILSSALPLLVKVYHVPQKTGRIMCSLLSVLRSFFLWISSLGARYHQL